MINETYKLWKEKAVGDPDLIKELIEIAGKEEHISDAFYKNLEFGRRTSCGRQGIATARA